MSEEMFKYAAKAYRQAIRTLMWSEVDCDGSSFDTNYLIKDIKGELNSFREQIDAFVSDNWEDLHGISAEQCGQDFVLTRNRHGAGFWDRGLGEVGERLASSAKPYGEVSLHLGDDDVLYLTS